MGELVIRVVYWLYRAVDLYFAGVFYFKRFHENRQHLCRDLYPYCFGRCHDFCKVWVSCRRRVCLILFHYLDRRFAPRWNPHMLFVAGFQRQAKGPLEFLGLQGCILSRLTLDVCDVF